MKHILLVDDDSSVLSVLARALSDYKVTVAQDSFEALVAAQRLERLDLLITDFMMPSMMGDELIARARERRPGLQVLAMTAHADILDHEAPDWWQSEPHLVKPFQIETLRDRVTSLIGEPSSTPTGRDRAVAL